MKAQEQQPSFWQEVGRSGGSEESPQAGGPPSSHISYLTFKSLVQLRRTLNTGRDTQGENGGLERWMDE